MEQFEYFCEPAGNNENYLDYDKVLLFFVLFSQSDTSEHEETKQKLLFSLLQEKSIAAKGGRIHKDGNQTIKTISILIFIACSLVPFLFKNVSLNYFIMCT